MTGRTSSSSKAGSAPQARSPAFHGGTDSRVGRNGRPAPHPRASRDSALLANQTQGQRVPDPTRRPVSRTSVPPSRSKARVTDGRPTGFPSTGKNPALPPRHPNRRPSRRPRRALRSFLLTFLLTMSVVLPCALGIGFYLKGRGPAGDSGSAAAQSTGTNPASSPAAVSAPETLTVDLSGLNSREAILLRRGGNILGEENADESIYPASLTKMMTVLLAAENFDDLDASVTLDEELFSPLWAANASMAGFEPGEVVTVRDLLYGAMLPSGAECCAAIAHRLDGSEAAFADRMNRRARDLGMENTHFVNATGLQDSEHRSTVRDLATLLDAALDNPTFREVFTAQRYSTSPTNLHPDGITVYSSALSLFQDTDLGRMTLLGGKTGFTDEAGLCLATLAEADGTEYILVTAGAPGQSHTDTAHAQDAATVYQRLSAALSR